MLLFLDVEGVLHPAPLPYRDAGVLSCIERFESLMRDFPGWNSLISSNWQQAFNLETIRDFFSNDVGGRIVGMTRIRDPGLPHLRQRKIEQYLQDNGQSQGRWLALED